MEHIAIEGHFPHIGPHIADARLGHALLNKGLLLLGHHHMEMDGVLNNQAPPPEEKELDKVKEPPHKRRSREREER